MVHETNLYILDSFALLAYLEGESGAQRVYAVLQTAAQGQSQVLMSMINLGEVLYIIERERGLAKTHEALAAIQQLAIDIIPADDEAVLAAAHLKAHHRLSFADAFAAATAQKTGGVLLTGDPEFHSVSSLISIEWLPQK